MFSRDRNPAVPGGVSAERTGIDPNGPIGRRGSGWATITGLGNITTSTRSKDA